MIDYVLNKTSIDNTLLTLINLYNSPPKTQVLRKWFTDKTPKYFKMELVIPYLKIGLKKYMMIKLIEASLAMATCNDKDVPKLNQELNRLKDKKQKNKNKK